MKSKFLFLLIALFIHFSCASTGSVSDAGTPDARDDSPGIKNVILVIGDGMGPQQVGLLNDYARRAPNSIYGGRPSELEFLARDGRLALAATAAEGALVVDSACSATHLATGRAAPLEAVGVDASGEAVLTVLKLAAGLGKSTGLVSDTRITHATPAAFASHAAHRSMENEIALQMLETRPDVMLSGGLRHFLPGAVNEDEELRARFEAETGGAIPIVSRRNDDLDLLAMAREKGYELVFDRKGLEGAQSDQVLGIFTSSGMADGIQERRSKEDPERREPTLREMSEAALEILSANEEGFFLMIEAGQIDWAGHNNDAGTLLHEMLRLDETVGMLRQWVEGREDTLLVVTADHETGGFGFSYSGERIPDPVELPGSVFSEVEHWPNFNFGSLDVLDGLFAQSMSFAEIFEYFDRGEEQTPEALMALVNGHSVFPIRLEEAERVLKRSPNRMQQESHPYLSGESLPHVEDFHPFYVYGEEIRMDLLGRALGSKQNVVWSTGTHTHTPVPVIIWGPGEWMESLGGFVHLRDVGELLISAVNDGGEK